MHRHHVLVQMIHDPQRSADYQRAISTPNASASTFCISTEVCSHAISDPRITALAIASSTDFCESAGGLATDSAATSFVYCHSRSSFRSGSPVLWETML